MFQETQEHFDGFVQAFYDVHEIDPSTRRYIEYTLSQDGGFYVFLGIARQLFGDLERYPSTLYSFSEFVKALIKDSPIPPFKTKIPLLTNEEIEIVFRELNRIRGGAAKEKVRFFEKFLNLNIKTDDFYLLGDTLPTIIIKGIETRTVDR